MRRKIGSWLIGAGLAILGFDHVKVEPVNDRTVSIKAWADVT